MRRFTFALLLFSIVFAIAPIKAADIEPPKLLLANIYQSSIDLDQYWVSEKYDGVRAYWNGRQLVSRQGNVFNAPAWFTAGFPDMPLDGELWMGHGMFEEVSGAVRREVPDEAQWRRIRYMVFDLPASDTVFDIRLKRIQALFSNSPSPVIAAVPQFKVADREALMAHLNETVNSGGEGLMLHKGDSLYRGLRSDDLLKLKPYDDAEAVVIAHLPGEGKYTGMLGALLVETPDKRRFRIGTGFSDRERANPPPIGSTVTYKYFGKTQNGLPRFASFLRVRMTPRSDEGG